jgi:hypothetical protein
MEGNYAALKSIGYVFLAKQILKVYHFMARRQNIFCKGKSAK